VKRILPILKIVLPIIMTVVLLQMVNVTDSQAAPPASGGVYHTVQYGETLFSIGRRYGVNPYTIAQANGLANPDCIYAGEVLYIPSGSSWDGCGGQPCTTPKSHPCNYSGCYQPTTYGHGYDYTGYYYYNNYPTYRRYSYTCGYYNNCY
jgi:LysM repeat protein